VGKSHTALLLAEAFFAYKDKTTDMYKGLLWISGMGAAATVMLSAAEGSSGSKGRDGYGAKPCVCT
jgi:hypothetical protein